MASELDPGIQSLLSGPLAVGEAVSFTGEFTRRVAADGGTRGAEYLYVVSNVSTAGAQVVSITVEGEGVSAGPAAAGEPLPPWLLLDRFPGAHAHEIRLTEPDDDAFHLRLRQREQQLVERLVARLPADGIALLREVAPTTVTVPNVGEAMELRFIDFDAPGGQICDFFQTRQGRVEAVSEQAIVVADLANPAGFTRADYERIAQDFDQKIYPLSVQNFGAPARQIGLPRTTIFYTAAVNQLAAEGAGITAGFFFSGDLLPSTACPASNQGELFYMRVPDPQGLFGPPHSVEDARRGTLATVMHEFQHMINASRRLYLLGASNFMEELWLNEALSHIAEELLFYQESGLSPGQNISLTDLRANQQRLDAVNQHQIQNLVRYFLYLLATPENSPLDTRALGPLEMRGAAWAFLRYLADRHAPEDAAFFFALVNTTERGVTNLRNRLGMEQDAFRTTLRQWHVANYTDDLLANIEPIYRQPSWNFRSILPVFSESFDLPAETFPLRPQRLGPQGQLSLGVRAGSAAFIYFGVPAGQRASLTTLSGGAAPPETVRSTLIRIR